MERLSAARALGIVVLVVVICAVLLFAWAFTYALLAPTHPALVGAKPL
jgi:hypothetical protein